MVPEENMAATAEAVEEAPDIAVAEGPDPDLVKASWQRVQLARHPKRPHSIDYINRLIDNFQELHGDRCFGDDQSIIGGMGSFEGQSVMILGQQKGRDTKEK